MPLSNVSGLVSDLAQIMDEKPEGADLPNAWGDAIANWLGSVTVPALEPTGVQALKISMSSAIAGAIASAVVPPGSSAEPPLFPAAFSTGIIAAAALILTDELVAGQVSSGVVVSPPIASFSFSNLESVGTVGRGSSFEVATQFAADLVTWASAGTVAGSPWA